MPLLRQMNPAKLCGALLCFLALLAAPAHALVICTPLKTTGATAATPSLAGDAPQIARRLAGLSLPDESFGEYARTAAAGWQAYLRDFGQPLHIWADREVRADAVQTVFYPFSGPDLPSLLAIYPKAARFVLISDQYATPYFDPFSLPAAEREKILRSLGEAWTRFGRLGFFLTQDLNKGGGRKFHISPTMILMAFAAQLGYEVRAVRPACLDPADLSIRTSDVRDAKWGSVRLELRKEGRDIIVDYLRLDLSNRGLGKQPERAMIEQLSGNPVLLKAASHLPQQRPFSILRNGILANTPLLVQDETGLEYEDMASHFNVTLHGVYVGAYHLFKEATNPSLVKAYQEQARNVRPLPFRLGYEKEAGSAIQVGRRK